MKRRLLPFALLATAAGVAAELHFGHHGDISGDAVAPLWALVHPTPPALGEDDDDRDGLADTLENALAARFAPIVVLDAADWVRPASIPWLLARVPLLQAPEALLAGALPAFGLDRPPLPDAVRKGSDDPRDWTTYVHVYPRADGGTNVQYWFYYPYNDAPLWLDHDSDWEHLTVRLDSALRPAGIYLSRHEDNDPGVYRRWARTRRLHDHPVVLAARGTHATYAGADDLAWYEKAGDCRDLDACRHPVWRTWDAAHSGGLQNLGERARPRVLAAALAYPGRWGAVRLFPGTSAPRGPAQQRGYCHSGFSACREPFLP